MKISQRNFMATQALYGLMIAYPMWTEDRQIDRAYSITDKMLRRARKSPRGKNNNNNNNKKQ